MTSEVRNLPQSKRVRCRCKCCFPAAVHVVLYWESEFSLVGIGTAGRRRQRQKTAESTLHTNSRSRRPGTCFSARRMDFGWCRFCANWATCSLFAPRPRFSFASSEYLAKNTPEQRTHTHTQNNRERERKSSTWRAASFVEFGRRRRKTSSLI